MMETKTIAAVRMSQQISISVPKSRFVCCVYACACAFIVSLNVWSKFGEQAFDIDGCGKAKYIGVHRAVCVCVCICSGLRLLRTNVREMQYRVHGGAGFIPSSIRSMSNSAYVSNSQWFWGFLSCTMLMWSTAAVDLLFNSLSPAHTCGHFAFLCHKHVRVVVCFPIKAAFQLW